MLETGTSSIGFSNELVNFFIFFGAEESDEVDAFLFFTAARSAALVFFASNAEGRIGLGVGAGGAEKFGFVLQAQLMELPWYKKFLQAQQLKLQLGWQFLQAQH